MAQQIIPKRLAISKANARMVAIVAASSFVTIFCLVASNAVFSQMKYEFKVVSAKNKANNQLKKNIIAYGDLRKKYQLFDLADPNAIGGTIVGTGDKDGKNSKIVLDALPGYYDFPALTSSLEKLLSEKHFHVNSIDGTDDELNQQSNVSSPSPKPIEIPFSFSVSGTNYAAVQDLMETLRKSIRPIVIDKIEISGGANDMSLSVDAHTYFQPGKNVTITSKVVK